ncbi:RagB/SusD family nutrient uptake outer membrane protein [Bacteroides faecis]|uniref:RagB/SusD family nutrient uptake outer membrane protein n=1 Tax=Bacteroides faecis TaxID=674529 RepID=UPI001021B197|nr:RagB/SusD family nutrient uptake outer membrane protein [Bacteroides faecis]KAA5266914.1 RagB/SusD family nutrient uptake outer membrane protein [Bacteroides faecis]MCE9009853.1 RagB/SusD family nutrient uptake outer membrane protein [Bacteroides faecis]RYT85108.1 RagB/SusD family nutrient uptake outer membrane protein [Bacteroides faecis]
MRIHNIIKTVCLAGSFALLSACEDWLEIEPKDRFGDTTVWGSEENADMFLNDIYNQLPHLNNETQNLDQYSDNSYVGAEWMNARTTIYTGALSPTSWIPGPWDMWKWGRQNNDDAKGQYERIRSCNLFITKVSESDFSAEYKKERLAEARFLRAWFYHYLWMAYGGVPIITEVLDNNVSTDIFYPRETAQKTFEFIDRELDEIKDDLPPRRSGSDLGRASKGAILTLKGWIELFHASDLRNPGKDKKRWETAAATLKDVIDLQVYHLQPTILDLWTEATNNNDEVIFDFQMSKQNGGRREGLFGPVFVKGVQSSWGNMQPTQELVDDYCMANGLPITDPASGYDKNNPYKNREKRFYQSILYDGSMWQGEEIITRVGVGSPNEIDTSSDSDVTNTGYYTRKTIDESVNGADNLQMSNGMANYIFFRYADVLLMYAEASLEAGDKPTAIKYLDMVRTRGDNMPSVNDTYPQGITENQLREIIRRDRRIELAFEDKRWWDILRWKICDGENGVMNKPIGGMKIEDTNGDGVWEYNYHEVGKRTFLPRMYYQPIPQYVIDKNPVICEQNGGEDGWVNGQNPGY